MTRKPNKRTMACYTRRLDLAIAHWDLMGQHAARDGDAEMARQYAADVKELRAFREAFVAQDFTRAGCLADAMDTLLRDQIPLQVYHTVFPNR